MNRLNAANKLEHWFPWFSATRLPYVPIMHRREKRQYVPVMNRFHLSRPAETKQQLTVKRRSRSICQAVSITLCSLVIFRASFRVTRWKSIALSSILMETDKIMFRIKFSSSINLKCLLAGVQRTWKLRSKIWMNPSPTQFVWTSILVE